MKPLPTAVIFDIDGTLADVSGIRHYVRPPRRDFASFHTASLFAPTHSWVADLARSNRHVTLVVTARSAEYRHVTRTWLAKHSIPYAELHMRPWGDRRRDGVVKREILADILTRFDVVHAYDDNPAVVAVWREHGIPVTVVPGWED